MEDRKIFKKIVSVVTNEVQGQLKFKTVFAKSQEELNEIKGLEKML